MRVAWRLHHCSAQLSVPPVLECPSDGRVPEHRGGLSAGGGWGRVWRRLLPLPAGQDGHTVLLVQVLLGPLASFDLSAQDAFLLNHLHHGGVSAEPRHLEAAVQRSASSRPFPLPAAMMVTYFLMEHVTFGGVFHVPINLFFWRLRLCQFCISSAWWWISPSILGHFANFIFSLLMGAGHFSLAFFHFCEILHNVYNIFGPLFITYTSCIFLPDLFCSSQNQIWAFCWLYNTVR